MMKSYKILNHNSRQPIFISCEHASGTIPKKMGFFGVSKSELPEISNYIDFGADVLSRMLARAFSARCIIPKYSRMVINLNKPIGHPKLINDNCFGRRIPGNENISKEGMSERVRKYYLPYHKRIRKEIELLRGRHRKVFYICVHTFFNKPGKKWAMDIGILYRYKKDSSFCRNIKKLLEEKTNFTVKYNQPYSAHKTAGYTMNTYGKDRNIRCVEFEINDKHMKGSKSIEKIGRLLIDVLNEAVKRA